MDLWKLWGQEVDSKPGQPLLQVGDVIMEAPILDHASPPLPA